MDHSKLNVKERPFVSIVILNWNGYKDTIECLTSLANSSNNCFEVILVDNASSDDSVSKIKTWINSDSGTLKRFRIIDASNKEEDNSLIKLTIIENSENLGFAKGNNIGIAAALKHNVDYVFLLNNDTIVQSSSLDELADFFERHKEFSVATPQIRYFDKPETIWNCGGKLNNFGSRKYFYSEKHFSALPEKDFLKITFITGCAIMVRSDIFERLGLLTEDFFFGEEDYEFSIRLKKDMVNAACALRPVIYHKVNSSISMASDVTLGKIYVHYLNRFIDLRKYMSAWKWQLWRYSYMVYIFVLLRLKHKIPAKTIRKFSVSLLYNSKTLNGVDKTIFDKYIDHDFR